MTTLHLAKKPVVEAITLVTRLLSVFPILLPIMAQSEIAVTSAFENRIYVSRSGSALTPALIFFSGQVASADFSNAPASDGIVLVHSAFGQPFAPSKLVPTFYCREISGYDAWAIEHLGEAVVFNPELALTDWGPKADSDLDGMNNLMEYGVGSDPNVADGLTPIRFDHLDIGETNLVQVTFRRRVDDPSLLVESMVSSNLLDWQSADQVMWFLTSHMVAAGIEETSYLDYWPQTSSPARFFRLRVTLRNEIPPTVDLLNPANNSYFATNSPVAIQFIASSSGCLILEETLIYLGTQLVARLTDENPVWTPTDPGVYDIVVRVVDDHGVFTSSASRRIIVDLDCDSDGIPDTIDPRPCIPNLPPVINMILITSTANFHSNGNLDFDVTATDLDGDTIAYALLAGANVIRPLMLNAHITLSLTDADSGLRVFTVQAKDPWGATSQVTRSTYLFRAPPPP